jgi:phage I-like protein
MNTGSTIIALALASGQESTDQWVHLLPSGRFAGRDGRGPWVIENMNGIIEETRRYAGKNLLAIDYDHQIDNSAKNGKPAPAAGWIKGLQSRTDGLWGLVEWTAKAAAQIENKEFLYLSPVFNFLPGTGEVKRLLRAGLTNNPALELTALASAEGNTMDEDFIKQLRKLLGLDEIAEPDAVIQAINELVTAKQSVNADPGQYVSIGDFKSVVTELQQMKHTVTEEDARLAVTTAINNFCLPPSLESWGLALCRSDRKAFDGFVNEISPLLKALRFGQTGGRPPTEVRAEGTLTDEQMAICDAMGHTPADYAKTLEN